MPLVSVIIPCYNSAAFVREAIESVLAQTLRDLELIVVSDGSTDSSLEVIQACKFQNPKIQIIQQSNGGVSNARNNGFKVSSLESRYILFLDADDVLEPEMIAHLVNFLELEPKAGIARCHYQFIDENSSAVEWNEKKFRYFSRGFGVGILGSEISKTPFESVFTLCGTIPSICLLRRSVLDLTGCFDENFGHHHEDADLFIRMALVSEVHYVNETLVRRRRHAGQNTADLPEFRTKVRVQTKKLYDKWLRGEGMSADKKQLIRQAWRFKEGRLEPYWAFQRAAKLLREGFFFQALRLCAGGFKAYVISLFYPAYFDPQ